MENHRRLKLTTAITMLVSGMIGSAIFSLSGLTIDYAGPSCIFSWIIAAIIEFCYGLAMVELATRYRKNGGAFVFPEMSFEGNKGRLLGFISAWGNLMADIVCIAFSAMYISIYLGVSFSGLEKYAVIISIGSILFCYIMNCLNISTTGKINFIFTILLAFILLLFSFVSITKGGFEFQKFIPFFSQGAEKNMGFLKAVPLAMIGYSSVTSISYMTDDIENPKKNIPKAVLIGMGIVVLLYLTVIISVVGTISRAELVNNNMSFIPLFAVCFLKLKKLRFLNVLISIAAVIALVTTMLVVMAISGRCLKAIADNGILPNKFSKNGKNQTPIVAMSVVTLCGMFMSFFPTIIEVLINLGAFFSIVTITINMISFYLSRMQNKGNKEHYVAPFGKIVIFIIIFIFILCYIPDIINGGYLLWLFTFVWYSFGLLIYFTKESKSN